MCTRRLSAMVCNWNSAAFPPRIGRRRKGSAAGMPPLRNHKYPISKRVVVLQVPKRSAPTIACRRTLSGLTAALSHCHHCYVTSLDPLANLPIFRPILSAQKSMQGSRRRSRGDRPPFPLDEAAEARLSETVATPPSPLAAPGAEGILAQQHQANSTNLWDSRAARPSHLCSACLGMQRPTHATWVVCPSRTDASARAMSARSPVECTSPWTQLPTRSR
mmetsp:Transcript_115/g.314  ORF Transcript_115/g.314 Transcript_115/m.314 type:complete len:219 (+) Transcript_115:193-849(+)